MRTTDEKTVLSAVNYIYYNKSSHFSLSLQNFLYRCIGVTLQQCFNKEVVKKQLQEILLTARHNDAVEREVLETQMSYDDFCGVVVLKNDEYRAFHTCTDLRHNVLFLSSVSIRELQWVSVCVPTATQRELWQNWMSSASQTPSRSHQASSTFSKYKEFL